MSYFYVQACSNGHYNITNKKLKEGSLCEECGLPITDKCPYCGEYIRKWTLYGATPILPGKEDYNLPALCSKCGQPFPWVEDEATLIRNGYNEETWSEFEKCTFAFFPGCKLCGYEPEIVVKAYDAIRFQHPDTGLFLHCCKTNVERIKQEWTKMGKPTMIMCCLNCLKNFKELHPEIKAISIYEFIRDKEISGGCNSIPFALSESLRASNSDIPKLAIELAEDMGATLIDADASTHLDAASDSDTPADIPYLTASMAERNALINSGKAAAHILELIFGFGSVNERLEHEHEHHHDHEPADGCAPADGYEPADGCAPADDYAPAIAECSGVCSSCSSCSSCDSSDDVCDSPAISYDSEEMASNEPHTLPTPDEAWQNRLEIKSLMLNFFWNEIE